MLLVDFNFIENFNEIKNTDQLYERYPNLSVSGFFHQTRKSYDFKLFFFWFHFQILPSSFVSSLQNVEIYNARKSRLLYVMQHEYAIVNAESGK